MTHHQFVRWATSVIAKHLLNNFYGTISFRIEAGKIIHSKIEYTEKPTIDTQA